MDLCSKNFKIGQNPCQMMSPRCPKCSRNSPSRSEWRQSSCHNHRLYVILMPCFPRPLFPPQSLCWGHAAHFVVLNILSSKSCFFNSTFYFEIIVHSHAVVRNNTNRSHIVSPNDNILQNGGAVAQPGYSRWYRVTTARILQVSLLQPHLLSRFHPP